MAQRWVHIVGENALLNGLLGNYLQSALEASWAEHRSLQEVIAGAGEGWEDALVLIDCFALSAEPLRCMLESEAAAALATLPAALFNVSPDASVELPALRCGIRGFFYRDDLPDTLAKGVVALFNKDYWVSRKLLVEFLSTPNRAAGFAAHYPGLTLRESELMGLLARGYSNQSIADRLFISIPTVKSHLNSIYRKINVSNRLQAVCWAERNGSNTVSG